MREPLFSLRLKIRYNDYFCNSVSNDAVITNYIGSVFCFLHAGGSHLCAYQERTLRVCSISWVPGWIPALWLITNYNVGLAKYAPSSIIVMAISIAGKHGLNTQFKRINMLEIRAVHVNGPTCQNMVCHSLAGRPLWNIVQTTESSQIFKHMPRESGVGLMDLYSLAFDKQFSFWFTELSIEWIKICLMHCARIIYL